MKKLKIFIFIFLCLFLFSQIHLDCYYQNNNFEKSVTIEKKSDFVNNSDNFLYFNKKNLYKNKSVFLNKSVFASNDEENLDESVEEQLDNIDFSELNGIVEKLDDNEKELFGSESFLETVKKLLNGEMELSYNNFFSYIISILFNDIKVFLPYFLLIVIIAIIISLLEQVNLTNRPDIKNIVSIVGIVSISTIIIKIVLSLFNSATSTIKIIGNFEEIIFPIILTLIASCGGSNTAISFQPTLAILSSVISKIFINILLPIFIFSIVFNIVGNLSQNIKLEKFSKFFISLFKSIIGFVFTIFIAILSIQGLTSSSLDKISIKTAKYALKNYIPILGSYLSDGVSIILLSANLIKNSVGVAGLLLIILLILKPITLILITMLLFKLVSSIIEPLQVKQMSNCLFSVSNSLSMLNLCLISLGLMAIISLGILLNVANIV